jgi:hypothetical protein
MQAAEGGEKEPDEPIECFAICGKFASAVFSCGLYADAKPYHHFE